MCRWVAVRARGKRTPFDNASEPATWDSHPRLVTALSDWSTDWEAVAIRAGHWPRSPCPLAEGRCTNLMKQTDVVPTCPMFDDLTVNHAPDMDEVPGDGSTRDRNATEKWHRRVGVHPFHRRSVGDEVAFTEDLVVFPACWPKVVPNDGADLLPALSTLRARGMIDHVLRHKLVDCRGVTLTQSTHQLLHDFFCVHDLTLSRMTAPNHSPSRGEM